MPRGFAPHTARPDTSRSTSVPGAGNPGEDDLLRARQTARNLDPFTAQHSAAYAAFCGITDRTTALDLHRHNITWDDVNDYTTIGATDPTEYATMKRLKAAGATPRRFKAWQDMSTQHGTTFTANTIAQYSQANLHPTQVAVFLTFPRHDRTPWSPDEVIAFVAADVTPHVADTWNRNGIRTPSSIAYLTRQGCEPHVAATYTSRGPRHATQTTRERKFLNTYRAIRAAAGNPDLAAVAMNGGISPEETTQWAHIDEPLARIGLYIRAGISAREWQTDPTIRDADTDTIATLAALNYTDHNITHLVSA